MSVYSTNQNRQLYVVTSVENSLDAIKANTNENLGKVFVGTDVDGNKYVNQHGHGGLVRSDLINPDSIMWATASGPKDTQVNLKAVTLKLDDAFSENVITGQDYIVRVNFRQLYGMSDEDIYQKFGAVHATAAMANNVSLFYKEMIYSLVKNFSRLYAPLLELGVNDKNNIVARASKDANGVHLYNGDGDEIEADVEQIYIAEKSQLAEWALGTKRYTSVYFEVFPTTVINTLVDNEEGVWGKVTPVTDEDELPTPVGNGHIYADLEYFCMGERGDQYRNIGWPNVIQTKYLVDPTKEYYSLDIHYAYQGTCEDIQKSEKTMTFISDKKPAINTLIANLGITSKVKKTEKFDE